MIRTYDAKLAIFSGLDPMLVQVVDRSLEAWAVADERGVICFYGYAADMLGEHAAVWFHAHRPLEGYKTTALRRCHRFIEELQRRYPTLYGTIDLEDRVATKWLRWLGFTLTEHEMEVEGKTVAVAVREVTNGH